MIMRKTFLLFFVFCCSLLCARQETSVAGFFPIENQGRKVWNFNSGWFFHLGDVENVGSNSVEDASWESVSLPHSVKLVPAEASGGRNYQGIAWYRKRFVVPEDYAEIHFEGIMGKQEFYLNGQLVQKHYGGYLPITLRLDKFHKGDTCVIDVKAENSDDKSFPPGKPQYALDFCYHGGIYRDAWIIAKGEAYITDAVQKEKTAGGGVFVHYSNISQKTADVYIDVDIERRNTKESPITYVLENTLLDADNVVVGKRRSRVTLSAGASNTVCQKIKVNSPHLWSPESPYLYKVVTRILKDGKTIDGGMTKVGIRSFAFRGKEGFWLNGSRYRQFVGANRHQDFAYVGNAVPNSQQWRDVLRLKQCGFNIIRTAHYPQDPSFMDACDELGIFIIVATPGWQYWNKNQKVFEERVLQNTRSIIRRDRNHPSVLMWEPILNETRFPEDFALKSLQITKDEYPYPYRPVAVADEHSAGVRENYDVVYGWPGDDEKADKPKQCIFTREYGEYVDDWYAHNNLNRASRSWGERPQLIQALSLSSTTRDMYRTTGQFIGGAQWHPFDHQRGYHPDPYWGGDFDAFRQPKYAAWMFASQRDAAQSEPMVFIAHELTQFSDSDVVVFSNCDSVRLSMYDGSKSWIMPVQHVAEYNAPVIFKNVWNFWEARDYSYIQKNWQKVNMVAEGIINGRVVCREKKMPSRRSTRLRLRVEEMGHQLVADGNDFVVVVCEVTDDSGNIRRLAKENIVFSVEGEGEIIGDSSIGANPRAVEWGTAPLLVRSTRNAGKIKVYASVQFPGTHAPTSAELEFSSVPYDGQFLDGIGGKHKTAASGLSTISPRDKETVLTPEQKASVLREVERQQAEFGVTK